MREGLVWRSLVALTSGELVPVRFRTRLLPALGFDLAVDTQIYAGARLVARGLATEPGVFINRGLYYEGGARVVLRTRVAIGPDVRFVTVTHEVGASTKRCLSTPVTKPISIGAGCWIAAGVTILPGVDIAPGCVIGAGSVVTRSTQPDGMYVGSPARRISSLPTEKSDRF